MVAGTVDARIKVLKNSYLEKGLWLFDYKVATRLWPECEYQLAWYYHMHKKKFPRLKLNGAVALRLNRDTGNWTPKDMKVITAQQLEHTFEYCLSMLKLWRRENEATKV